jgi:FAD binding domain
MSGPLPGSTAIAGDVVRPGGTGYDDARRIYNAVHDSNPALVVRATSPTDVVGALALAERQRHDVTVRGGGHSLAGYSASDGGLLIDLSGVDGIDIDAAARVAVVGAGATAGQLTAATCRHGLVVPFGDSPDVGVGGITLGGGIGWLSRKYGLTLDSLERVEIVLADGQVVLADHDEYSDLFWAIRGGGGNFGVVTRFRFRLNRLGSVVGGVLALPATPAVVSGVVELADSAPDDLGTICLVTRLPPLPSLPADVHGRPAVLITLVWCGDQAEGERYVDRFRRLTPPLVDLVRQRPYPEMYSVLAGTPESVTNITSSFLADTLDAQAIDHIIGSIDQPEDVAEGALAAVELRVLGAPSPGYLWTPRRSRTATRRSRARWSPRGSSAQTPTATGLGCRRWRTGSLPTPRAPI